MQNKDPLLFDNLEGRTRLTFYFLLCNRGRFNIISCVKRNFVFFLCLHSLIRCYFQFFESIHEIQLNWRNKMESWNKSLNMEGPLSKLRLLKLTPPPPLKLQKKLCLLLRHRRKINKGSRTRIETMTPKHRSKERDFLSEKMYSGCYNVT